MQTSLTRKRPPLMAWLGVIFASALLAACGGGGGGASSGSTGGSGGSSGSSGAVNLVGVVATGTPLIGATVSAVDANGTACGSATTALADGSYSLTLTCASPTLPLLVEASGPDMSGTPAVLHSVVQSVTTGASARNIANITPLTNAVVALLLGGDPTAHFNNAGTRHTQWTLLSSSAALTAASNFVKTVVAANLRDAKLTNTATVNLFSDATFTADKTGVDGALEGLNITFGKDTNGNELLQLSNRLRPPCNPSSVCSTSNIGSPEVEVNLTTAKSNLSGSTPTVAAGATVSPIKATTSASTVMPYVAGLETLRAVLNVAMRQSATDTALATLEVSTGKPLFSSSFTAFDGDSALGVAGTLAGYGGSGYQLSSFQIKGCLDYPIPTSGCSKIKVAALVRDALGIVHQRFENVVSYATSTGWSFVGNDHRTPWYIYPVSWLTLDGTGAQVTSTVSAPNPGQGIQVIVRSLDFMYADLSMPSGNSAHFYYCSLVPMDTMCLGATETGDIIRDQVLPTTVTSWIGAYDTRPGARYQISTVTLSSGSENNSTILTAGLPSTSSLSAYPIPDGMTVNATSNPTLSIANFVSGLTITWDTWAAANPGLRMIEVRGVITSTTTAPIKQAVNINPLSVNSATLPVFSTIPSDAQAYTLWLVAQDVQGRRYITKMDAMP